MSAAAPTEPGTARNHGRRVVIAWLLLSIVATPLVAIPGVADNATPQCGYAPCPMSTAHRTVQFTFHTTTPGHYRWQCFVPCAAGWIDGFGGPMQTIGYMDGFLNVKA